MELEEEIRRHLNESLENLENENENSQSQQSAIEGLETALNKFKESQGLPKNKHPLKTWRLFVRY